MSLQQLHQLTMAQDTVERSLIPSSKATIPRMLLARLMNCVDPVCYLLLPLPRLLRRYTITAPSTTGIQIRYVAALQLPVWHPANTNAVVRTQHLSQTQRATDLAHVSHLPVSNSSCRLKNLITRLRRYSANCYHRPSDNRLPGAPLRCPRVTALLSQTDPVNRQWGRMLVKQSTSARNRGIIIAA